MTHPTDLNDSDTMDTTGKRQTEYAATAPRWGLTAPVAALSLEG